MFQSFLPTGNSAVRASLEFSSFEKRRNIFSAGRMVGDYDMTLYLNARTPEELPQRISLYKKELRSQIIHYDPLVRDRVHYWGQFTPGIFNYFAKQSGQ